jgi:hypothetical protein
MPVFLTKATAAFGLAGGFMLASHVFAVPVPPSGSFAPFVIPVIDEQEAVERHLDPGDYPPGSQDGGAANPAPKASDGDGGNAEIRELQSAFPSTNWPPSDRPK